MNKRKLYPDECPVFAYDGEILTAIPWLHIDDSGARAFRETIHMHRDTSEVDRGIMMKMNHGDEFLVRPLTPAAVELWEHVAGKRWEP